MVNITKEFLEEALQKEIKSFKVTPGSEPGDNFTSLLYTIQIELNRQYDSIYLLLKCYPTNPSRQEWLSTSNLFNRELLVYTRLIPELIKFQGHPDSDSILKPPVPDFVYGKAIDYTGLPLDQKFCTNPLDNCIIMPDLRKSRGFRVANRLIGLDLDHCKLVMIAQAKFHVLSWAYKVRSGVTSLKEKFPFLQNSFLDTMDDTLIEGMLQNSLHLFRQAIKNGVKDEDEGQKLMTSLERVEKVIVDAAILYLCDTKQVSNVQLNKDNILHVPHDHLADEIAWDVAVHGDSWLNNMLFRYNEETGKPLEIILVDLQLVGERDLMADLVYCIYTSTTSDFRKEHLDDLLQLYVNTFFWFCEELHVDPLPGFNLSEFKRRFHRAKIFGFFMSLISMPVILNGPENARDLETTKGEGDKATTQVLINEMMDMMQAVESTGPFRHRVIDLVHELCEEGVI